MKITIQKAKNKFCIGIPNALIFSRFAAGFIKFEIRRKGEKPYRIRLYPECMKNIRKCIKDMRKLHTDWCLIEAEDAEGSTLNISL